MHPSLRPGCDTRVNKQTWKRLGINYTHYCCTALTFPCARLVGKEVSAHSPSVTHGSYLESPCSSCAFGETDRGLCSQSCLDSESPNQSCATLVLSLSAFPIAHSPSPHSSDGGHVWSRAENGQSGRSLTHHYYHCSSYLSVCQLYIVQPYDPAPSHL